MRKIKLFAILTVMLTMLISVNAFAAVYDGEPGLIEITGGIDMESEYESTFDDTRTITGRAERGSVIVIEVYVEDDNNGLSVAETKEIKVGVSGYFSTSVDLYEGENYIVITNEGEDARIAAVIKRKSEEIKARLERGEYSTDSAMAPFIPFSVD
ncbi:MAG TPA: hypothetical protein H9688_04450 [Firmicutes bacterium]|nr:hypothetical protein [Bacillota bacterium]